MSYNSANLSCLYSGAPGAAPRIWYYKGTDIHTDVDAADFFSDGSARGWKVDDLVAVVKTDATKGVTWHTVGSVTAGGAATINAAILA